MTERKLILLSQLCLGLGRCPISRNSCSYLFVVTALRSATLVVLVCVGSLANHVSMVEDFKQRAFEICRVTLGDTKDSLQGVSVVSDVTGRVRVRCLSTRQQ